MNELSSSTPALPEMGEHVTGVIPAHETTWQKDAASSRTFHLIWFGQMVSLIGSSISDFALSIWVYTSTGSVLQFALISLAFVLPQLLVAPFAGVIVDRWNRRTVMILSDSLHALLMGVVLLIVWVGELQSWHLYLITTVAAVASTFQWPAYQAIIPQLVPKAKLGQANGLVDLARGIAQLVAPLGGGVLLFWIGIPGIVLLDLVTFFVALTTLLLVRVPMIALPATQKPHRRELNQDEFAEPLAIQDGADEHHAKGVQTIFQEFLEGWSFIRADRGLLMLMLYIAVTVFLTSFVSVLTPPLVLAFATEAQLGLILTVGGAGLLIGGLLMSSWGGPQPRIYGLLIFDLLPIAAMLLVGFLTSIPLLMVAAFLFFVGLPISRGSAQSIWQGKVPSHLQGRVFVTRDMLAIGATPIAFLAAGPLADYLFEPLLQANGALASTVGLWMGVGTGRGIAFLFFVLGLCFLITNLLAWSAASLRTVEKS